MKLTDLQPLEKWIELEKEIQKQGPETVAMFIAEPVQGAGGVIELFVGDLVGLHDMPPLAGFFGKFFVFMAAIDAGLYGLAVIGVLASVVGAFYYIRIVKLIYFDEPEEAFDRPVGREIGLILVGTTLVILCLWALPGTIVDGASAAAASSTSFRWTWATRSPDILATSTGSAPAR